MHEQPITIAYTPEFLDWRLREGHPTNPERARIAVEQIKTWAHTHAAVVRELTPTLDWDRLTELYLQDLGTGSGQQQHIARVRGGLSDEWPDRNERLGEVAALMFLGTVALVEQIQTDGFRSAVYFNPQGAKHHAFPDHSSGFCVFNDIAWAARHFMRQGKRVAYLDWDAHHGDGVEAICRHDREIASISIHDRTIFPGTGRASDSDLHVYNFPLSWGAGDAELETAIGESFGLLETFEPDVLLIACGADGLAGDPLSTLQYSLDGLMTISEQVGAFAARFGGPVLIGGAGGYQPLTETPRAWADTVTAIHGCFVDSHPSRLSAAVHTRC